MDLTEFKEKRSKETGFNNIQVGFLDQYGCRDSKFFAE
jgi:hypothetical protein